MNERMDERWTDPRQRMLKAGTIIYNNSSSVFDCTVRNLSKTGACLMVASPMGLPEEFDLMMEGARRHCIVSWRRADRIGVKFQ
jgi:hypothetical protein